MNLKKINWVKVEGESGRKPRPMKEHWVLENLNQCKVVDVKFFFKQWGGTNKKKTDQLLLDQTWGEMPY
jgi:protein gp37